MRCAGPGDTFQGDASFCDDSNDHYSNHLEASWTDGGSKPILFPWFVLQTGLRHPERLAGILALSTYLPLKDSVEKERSAANKDLPIFLAHGRYDDMIRMERATQTRDALTALGYPVEWHEYPMPHSVCPEEIGHIAQFLLRIL